MTTSNPIIIDTRNVEHIEGATYYSNDNGAGVYTAWNAHGVALCKFTFGNWNTSAAMLQKAAGVEVYRDGYGHTGPEKLAPAFDAMGAVYYYDTGITLGHDEDAPINIWVGNLRKYNEGELCGDWVALPLPKGCDSSDVFDALGIDIDRDEYHIPDWECCIPALEYFEYADIDELNEQAETWANMEDYEREAVGVRMELCGEDFATAMEHADDVRIWHGCTNMSDVAAEYVEECGMLDSMPENLRYYFDYEAFGRDLDIEGCFDYSTELGCIVEAF